MPDHVHLLVSIPPKLSVSQFMGYLKGKYNSVYFIGLEDSAFWNFKNSPEEEKKLFLLLYHVLRIHYHFHTVNIVKPNTIINRRLMR